jgi:hypothetical protein
VPEDEERYVDEVGALCGNNEDSEQGGGHRYDVIQTLGGHVKGVDGGARGVFNSEFWYNSSNSTEEVARS